MIKLSLILRIYNKINFLSTKTVIDTNYPSESPPVIRKVIDVGTGGEITYDKDDGSIIIIGKEKEPEPIKLIGK